MKLSICTIQRDRAQWLPEWVAFHYLVGFRYFYIYLHKCTDNSIEVVKKLQNYFNIQVFIVPDDTIRPQLVCYQHAYQEFNHQFDWIAFIDGDEFLFPTNKLTIEEILNNLSYEKLSAIGVWWVCFGSNGHIEEPKGLIIENFQMRPPLSFKDNSHFKSIVMGRQGVNFSIGANAHFFNTIHGTKDENLRELSFGFMPNLSPTYDNLRINHYVCQSFNYFKNFKQCSGAADAGASSIRPDEWWVKHDKNDEHDSAISKYIPDIFPILNEIGFHDV